MGYGRLKGFSALVLVVLLTAGCSREFTVDVSPFEIKVVDEEGNPIEGALVVTSYRTSYGSHNVVDGVLHASEKRTDERGVAEFQGWRKKTTRGFGWRDPTITVSKFGYLTQYDGTKSKRKKHKGVFHVDNIRPAVLPVFTLITCLRPNGSKDETCMSQAYHRMHTLLGPIPDRLQKQLPEYAKEEARHEKYQRSIR